MRYKWGIYLCSQNQSLPIAPNLTEGLDAFVFHANGPQDIPLFLEQTRDKALERMLVSCCAGPDELESAMEGEGLTPVVQGLDLHTLCYNVHHNPASANAKALRMIKGAMEAGEASPAPNTNMLDVDNRVLIVSDAPEGVELAKNLEQDSQVLLFASGDMQAFPQAVANQINTGRLADLKGRLGDFRANLDGGIGNEDNGGNGAAGAKNKSREITSGQVVLISEEQDYIARTGLHLIEKPDAQTLHDTAEEVKGLMGTFSKPEHLSYDTDICAGGSADQEACGLCITHCPYDTIARNPDNHLRIVVDHLGCENCGACASACPTGALKYTEPTPEGLYRNLSALLRKGEDDEPGRGAGADAAASTAGTARTAGIARTVVVYHCPEQGQQVLEHAAKHKMAYPETLLPVEVPCLRAVSEANMLGALAMGADGVALLGCEACPNGERELMEQKFDLTQKVLDAFDLGTDRVRIITSEPGEEQQALQAMQTFADSLAPNPISHDGRHKIPGPNRDAVSDAIGTLLNATGKTPGGVTLAPHQPYAFAEIKDEGCTLCRSCTNVCPSHAFLFDEGTQSLKFKHINCVGCGLCQQVCPEKVITLRRELYLDKESLDYLTVVQDDMVHCAKCDKPFINRKALETIESRVLNVPELLETFMGDRKNILRMCPDCRGVAAMMDVNQGWTP